MSLSVRPLLTGDGNTMIDAAGRAHVPDPDARILSLVPSLTETVFALGLGDRLVGRTHYCVHPKDEVEAIVSVGGTKKANWRKVEDLSPTHALLNIDENPKSMIADLEASGITPVVTHPIEVRDNIRLLELMGHVFDEKDAASALIDEFEVALAKYQSKPRTEARRVLYLIWKDPWMTISADTYIAKMLAKAGWTVISTGEGGRYPEVSMTDQVLKEVDLVLFSSEPYAFTEDHLLAFQQAHPAHALKAHLVDGEMLSWYGVRAARGLDYLYDFSLARAS